VWHRFVAYCGGVAQGALAIILATAALALGAYLWRTSTMSAILLRPRPGLL
jgi:hypothetical protein